MIFALSGGCSNTVVRGMSQRGVVGVGIVPVSASGTHVVVLAGFPVKLPRAEFVSPRVLCGSYGLFMVCSSNPLFETNNFIVHMVIHSYVKIMNNVEFI